MGHERDVPAGLVPREADRFERLRGPFEFLLEVHAAREELRQILRNHGATILNGGLYLFEWRPRCSISKRDASLYPTGAFLCGHGFGAPSRPRGSCLLLTLLERFHSRGRAESSRPHGRHDRLRIVRHIGPERRRPRDVDLDRGEGGRPPREDPEHVRHVRSDPPRLSVPGVGGYRERGRCPRAARGRAVHGPARKRPRGLGRDESPVHATVPVRPAGEEQRRSRPWVRTKYLRPREHEPDHVR